MTNALKVRAFKAMEMIEINIDFRSFLGNLKMLKNWSRSHIIREKGYSAKNVKVLVIFKMNVLHSLKFGTKILNSTLSDEDSDEESDYENVKNFIVKTTLNLKL